MKIILSTLLLSACLATTANADQGKRKKGSNIDQVVSSLQLNAEKSASLKSLMENQRQEKHELRQQGKKDREQKKVLRQKHRDALLAVLGYEKMYEFETLMRENRKNRGMRKKQKYAE